MREILTFLIPCPRNLTAKLDVDDDVGLMVFGSNESDKKARRTGKEAWFGLLLYGVKALLYDTVCHGMASYGLVPVAKKGGIGQQIIKKGWYRATN